MRWCSSMLFMGLILVVSFPLLQSYLSQSSSCSARFPRRPLFNAWNNWFKETKKSLLVELENNSDQHLPSTPLYREPVESFFYYWNLRDMNSAVLLCDEECEFEDTLFPTIYKGRARILTHLNNVANSVPENFKFVIDELAEDQQSGNVGIQWHVEADNQPVPFTRGASMYKVNKNGLITKGFDVPEPLLKIGSINLSLLRVVSKILVDPWRLLPLSAWIFYLWFLFFSDIPPGANVTHMTADIFQEVVNLSINFWLIIPVLFRQSAPIVHPVLEGVFNLILVWSLLFAGFIVDGKKIGPNAGNNGFLPNLVGMQFLTNVFYLPYLFQREKQTKQATGITLSELSSIERFFESKSFPLISGLMGLFFVAWATAGRYDAYGDLWSRLNSFQSLVSGDRLAFSFLFDGFCYFLFQGWLIRDDMTRRLSSPELQLPLYARIGQTVPLFGLVIYFLLRPTLQETDE